MRRKPLLIPAVVVVLVALFGAGYGGARALGDGDTERPVGTVTLPRAASGASATVHLPSFTGTVPALAPQPTTSSSTSTPDSGTTSTGQTGGGNGGGTGGGSTTFSFGSD